MLSLSKWAKQNGKTYMQGYRAFNRGEIDGAYKDNDGSIWIKDSLSVQTVVGQRPTSSQPVVAKSIEWDEHKLARGSDSNRSSNNSKTTILKYGNIDSGFLPYLYSGQNDSCINIRDCIELCQKAYFNFSSVRNVIDLMTEFSCSDIFLQGGNETSREFFLALFKKINLAKLQDQFFREYYRSGNVFLYRQDVKINSDDAKSLKDTYDVTVKNKDGLTLPFKYILLNPADIFLGTSSMFTLDGYEKQLNPYEIESLRNPKNEEDKRIFDSLSPEVKKAIKGKGNNVQISIQLPTTKVTAIFYKKQDYEPFGVSLIYPVLDDIEWKAEMKKMDIKISRTLQQAILLVTCGTEPEKGGINQKNIDVLEEIFANESVGRVLVADYTTKAEFIIPQIADILDPKKYQIIDKDIREGLNNILVGSDEKFANKSVGLQVFVERLKQAREAFLNDFLIPEIKKISKAMGFKNYPNPKFVEINLKDELEFTRIYTRLIEIGAITPPEGIQAIETGRLPTKEESMESQEEYRKLRDKGYYEPIAGGPYSNVKASELKAESGRPPGVNTKKKTNKVSPVGGKFSGQKLKEVTILANNLRNKIEAGLLNKFKLKKLDEKQSQIADGITSIIIHNEQPDDWEKSIAQYVNTPVDTKPDQVEKINEIALEHQLDGYSAALLYHSRIPDAT